MRIFLDTDVLVSAVATRGLCADVLRSVLAEHELIAGEAVLGEVRRVLRHKLHLPAGAVAEVEAFLRQQAIVVEKAPRVTIRIRDKDDLAIIAEAVAGSADVLVTGDRDLLDIAAAVPLTVVTPRDLWELLRSNRSTR